MLTSLVAVLYINTFTPQASYISRLFYRWGTEPQISDSFEVTLLVSQGSEIQAKIIWPRILLLPTGHSKWKVRNMTSHWQVHSETFTQNAQRARTVLDTSEAKVEGKMMFPISSPQLFLVKRQQKLPFSEKSADVGTQKTELTSLPVCVGFS